MRWRLLVDAPRVTPAVLCRSPAGPDVMCGDKEGGQTFICATSGTLVIAYGGTLPSFITSAQCPWSRHALECLPRVRVDDEIAEIVFAEVLNLLKLGNFFVLVRLTSRRRRACAARPEARSASRWRRRRLLRWRGAPLAQGRQ